MSMTIRQPTYTDNLIAFIENSDVSHDLKAASVALIKTYRSRCAEEYKANRSSEEKNVDPNIIQNGKYKGRTVQETLVYDRPYVVWLSNQPFVKKNVAHHTAVTNAISR